MKRVYYFLLSFIVSLASHAQQNCSGVIIDSISGKPVEFSNIGIVGRGVGTVSDEKGEYSFSIPDSLSNQAVRISMIGYKPRVMSVKDFARLNKIRLSQDALNLSEVAVKAKKLKIKTLGNETTHQSVVAGFKKNNLGAEIAVKLNIRQPKTQLRNFKVNITSNKIEKVMFRLNVYSSDEKGMPKENILKQNIIIEPKEKTGLINIDLKPYGIFVDEDVFVSIEWIKDLGDATGLTFSTKLVGSGTYFRMASQDKWEKVNSIGVGLHVEVGY